MATESPFAANRNGGPIVKAVTWVVVGALCILALELLVLRGDQVYQLDATGADIHYIEVQFPGVQHLLSVAVKGDDNPPFTVRLLAPDGTELSRAEVTGGAFSLHFTPQTTGIYEVHFKGVPPDTRVSVSVFQDDRRFLTHRFF